MPIGVITGQLHQRLEIAPGGSHNQLSLVHRDQADLHVPRRTNFPGRINRHQLAPIQDANNSIPTPVRHRLVGGAKNRSRFKLSFFTSTAPVFRTELLLSRNITSRTYSFYYPRTRPQGRPRCLIVSSTNANYSDWANLSEQDYEASKQDLIEKTLDHLNRYVLNIRERIDHVEAATPKTFEHYTHHVAGASFGRRAPRSLAYAARTRASTSSSAAPRRSSQAANSRTSIP